MDKSSTSFAMVLTLAQQVIGFLLCNMTLGYLPVEARQEIYGFLIKIFEVVDLAHPVASVGVQSLVVSDLNHMVQDLRIVLWFSACNIAAFVAAWWLLRAVTNPPTSVSQTVGAMLLALSSTSIVLLHETWHRLVTGYVLFLVIQVAGWWCWIATNTPLDRISDIRETWAMARHRKLFNPLRYIRLKKGVFAGLDESSKPTYMSIRDMRQHIQVLGQTRAGKNVAVATLLDQSVQLGECVIIIDPKADFYMPGVMAGCAQRAGVRMTFIDLRPDQPPQLNLLADCSAQDVEEMLIQIFDLIEKGDNADVYRIEDRAAARLIAALGARSFPELFEMASEVLDLNKTRRLFEALKELSSLPVIQTTEGVDLSTIVAQPGILYVVGSTRHEPTIRLQKMTLLRILQLIDKAGQQKEGAWTALFLDELKYLLSPAALQACGVIADRRCALRVAHQALADLDDTSLPATTVRGAVLVNCAVKFLFRTNDPDTALWMARLCGTVPIFAELAQKAIFKFSKNEGGWRESVSALFDANVFLSLAPLHAILFGVGVPVKIRVGYLPVLDSPRPISALHRSIKFREAI
jgi:hypothetical protein